MAHHRSDWARPQLHVFLSNINLLLDCGQPGMQDFELEVECWCNNILVISSTYRQCLISGQWFSSPYEVHSNYPHGRKTEVITRHLVYCTSILSQSIEVVTNSSRLAGGFCVIASLLSTIFGLIKRHLVIGQQLWRP